MRRFAPPFRSVRSMEIKRALLMAVLGTLLLLPGTAPVSAQAPDGPLTFFQNYFVTGDYVVGSTSLFRKGLNGLATDDIDVSGVPDGAEVLAAYLYVQTTIREGGLVEDAGIAGATFKGNALNLAGGPIPKALNEDSGTQACWSYGWNPQRSLVVYRADVLRFLEIGADGKHLVNGRHQVQVADSGRGRGFSDDEDDRPTMTGPRALGASLVVVYRHPDPGAPMRAVVIYDGGVTKRNHEPFSQTIQGFYQPTAQPEARMTHIVGRGQGLFLDRVQINGQIVPNTAKPSIRGAGNKGAQVISGATALTWNHQTFDLADSALRTYPALTTVSVAPRSCLSWSAIVVSTKVQDDDGDGLLDIWESFDSDILDPTGQPLPNLKAMGAYPNVKDLFVEIGALSTNQPITYGTGDAAKTKGPHSHFPSQKALDLVGDAFAKEGINVHFDVGNNYQEADLITNEVDPYIIRWDPNLNLAKGGKTLSETEVCAADPNDPTSPLIDCLSQDPPLLIPGQYPHHPGTVGWKTGFFFYRDKLLEFDSARKNIFRFAFFAHALGLPKSEDELLPDGTSNPDFHTPRTSSGVADWAGGDVLVTLGSFDDNDGNPVGTDFMQASTLMHEWGHNFGRRHGGDLFEPNCKPQYLSVMNYLYQLRGLLDEQGIPHLNYAGAGSVELSEASLSADILSTTSLPYRMGWYVPKGTSYLEFLTGGAATKHCDGSPLLTDPIEPEMVRVDAISVSGPIDWDADGTDASVPSLDINFNGSIELLRPGSNDWAKIRLNQLGARRSIGGLFLDKDGRPTIGPMSLNVGKGDLGKGDLGKGDLGKGDLGKGDLGKGDLGKGDLGKGDLGKGDLGNGIQGTFTLGKGDLGKGDLGRGDLDVGPGTPLDEPEQDVPPSLTFEDARAVSGGKPAPPTGLQACLTSEGVCSTDGGDVRLSWLKPNEGKVERYFLYRFEYEEPFKAPAELSALHLLNVYIDGSATTFLDTSAPAGKHLAYYMVARYADGDSGISNFATIETPAHPVILMVDLGTNAPPSSLGDETLGFQSMTPFDPDTRESSSQTTVPSPLGGDLTFDSSVDHLTVPDSWATWSHGYTGDVYYTPNATLTMTLPAGTTAFYFYAEPNQFAEFNFTVTTSDGGTAVVSSGNVAIHGEAGARGFGFYSSNTTIVSVVVTGDDPFGFAVGEFGIAGPPLTPVP